MALLVWLHYAKSVHKKCFLAVRTVSLTLWKLWLFHYKIYSKTHNKHLTTVINNCAMRCYLSASSISSNNNTALPGRRYASPHRESPCSICAAICSCQAALCVILGSCDQFTLEHMCAKKERTGVFLLTILAPKWNRPLFFLFFQPNRKNILKQLAFSVLILRADIIPLAWLGVAV